MLEAVLLVAGLIAGVTGAWSPCGFSMVDTLAPHGYAGRLRTTLVACVTFAAGALAGGIATFGGLAYNMRVMRGNLLDTLNAQYVETARAKGLPESAVVLRHAVPNALHPLVMYQGVVLPYMLTGEIEVAIVFALATVGPAIVGSMAVGDVYVTATFMLVLATTLIIGNIIADMLLAPAPAIPPPVRRPRPLRRPPR